MKNWRVVLATLVAVVLVANLAVGTVAQANDAFSIVVDVMRLVQREYWREISANTLIQGALKGVMESLGDRNSRFMPPVEHAQFIEHVTGAFGGIGVAIEVTPNGLLITRVFRNSPAARAGLQAGDVILLVGDRDTRHLTLQEINGLLRGEVGTPVTVSFFRGQAANFQTVTILRDRVIAPSASWREHEGFGYIFIERFGEGLVGDIELALRELAHTRGIILDMRGCPGGLMDSLLFIAPRFVRGRVLGQVMSRGGRVEPIPITGVGLLKPLVVLVDGRTASAAEILTGAIQDTDSGFVIGTRTFGKGTAQRVHTVAQDIGGVSITVLGYLTPRGRMIDGEGLEPNLVVLPVPPQFLPPLAPLLPSDLVLRQGDRGESVRKLQAALIAAGLMSGQATGYFDWQTRLGVIRVQHREGLFADGVTSPEVINALNALLVRPPVHRDAQLEAAVEWLQGR
jgi:carboxyl-terminal processing protease